MDTKELTETAERITKCYLPEDLREIVHTARSIMGFFPAKCDRVDIERGLSIALAKSVEAMKEENE